MKKIFLKIIIILIYFLRIIFIPKLKKIEIKNIFTSFIYQINVKEYLKIWLLFLLILLFIGIVFVVISKFKILKNKIKNIDLLLNLILLILLLVFFLI